MVKATDAAGKTAYAVWDITLQDAADTTAPVLSAPSGTKVGTSDFIASIATDEGNGVLYWFVSTSGTAPSRTDLEAGTGAVDSGSQAVAASGTQNITGNAALSAGTTYYVHFAQDDASGNESAIATSAGFTTDAAMNANVAASEIVAFNPAYWTSVDGFTPNGDGTMTVDKSSTLLPISNELAGSGSPRIEIDASATYYEIRFTVTAAVGGTIGINKAYARRDNGFGAIEILGSTYKSYPGGSVPTELVFTTTGLADSDRTQMEVQIRNGSALTGFATISAFSVRAAT